MSKIRFVDFYEQRKDIIKSMEIPISIVSIYSEVIIEIQEEVMPCIAIKYNIRVKDGILSSLTLDSTPFSIQPRKDREKQLGYILIEDKELSAVIAELDKHKEGVKKDIYHSHIFDT